MAEKFKIGSDKIKNQEKENLQSVLNALGEILGVEVEDLPEMVLIYHGKLYIRPSDAALFIERKGTTIRQLMMHKLVDTIKSSGRDRFVSAESIARYKKDRDSK